MFLKFFDVLQCQSLGYPQILLCLRLIPHERIHLRPLRVCHCPRMVDLGDGADLVFEGRVRFDEVFQAVRDLERQIEILLSYRLEYLP